MVRQLSVDSRRPRLAAELAAEGHVTRGQKDQLLTTAVDEFKAAQKRLLQRHGVGAESQFIELRIAAVR
jgi:hypothetical protein